MMSRKNNLVPLTTFTEYEEEEMRERASEFYKLMQRRRSVRDFASKDVPREVIEDCVRAASTAPSGANMQPWQFVVVSDPEVKSEIRQRAEAEERVFYEERATDEWLEALEPLGTNPEKPFLEVAPYLIAVFARNYGYDEDGNKHTHYYVRESVGIAVGILITAIHNAGMVSLPHTPSPMGFLNEVLNRPDNEKPFLLLVIGYPADEALIPEIEKKPLDEILTFL